MEKTLCPICKIEMIEAKQELDDKSDEVNITYFCLKCGHKSVKSEKNGEDK